MSLSIHDDSREEASQGGAGPPPSGAPSLPRRNFSIDPEVQRLGAAIVQSLDTISLLGEAVRGPVSGIFMHILATRERLAHLQSEFEAGDTNLKQALSAFEIQGLVRESLKTFALQWEKFLQDYKMVFGGPLSELANDEVSLADIQEAQLRDDLQTRFTLDPEKVIREMIEPIFTRFLQSIQECSLDRREQTELIAATSSELQGLVFSPGDILTFRDGSRAQIISIDPKAIAAKVAHLDPSGKVSAQIIDVAYDLSAKTLTGLEKNPQLLLPSILLPKAIQPVTLGDLHVGDLIRGRDERGDYREEILEIIDTASSIFTSSVVRRADGQIEFHNLTPRGKSNTAIETSFPDATVDVRRAEPMRDELPSRFGNWRSPYTRREHLYDVVQMTLREIEGVFNGLLACALDAARQGMIEGEGVERGPNRKPKVSQFLMECRTDVLALQNLSDGILSHIPRLVGYCDALSLQKILSVVPCNREDLELAVQGARSIAEGVDILLQPLRQIGLELSRQGRASLIKYKITDSLDHGRFVKSYESLLEGMAGTLTKAFSLKMRGDQFFNEGKGNFRTKFHRTSSVLQYPFLSKVSALIRTAPAGVDAFSASRRGVVISDYSPEGIMKLVESGVGFITLHTREGRLVGAGLLFGPEYESDTVRRIRSQLSIPLTVKACYLDLILIDPNFQGSSAYHQLMDQLALESLRRGVPDGRIISEILDQNKASRRAAIRVHGVIHPSDSRPFEGGGSHQWCPLTRSIDEALPPFSTMENDLAELLGYRNRDPGGEFLRPIYS